VAAQVIEGFVTACRQNGCSLVGGETAEMPGFYNEDEYDLAGTIVGVVDEKRLIRGQRIRKGDILLALPSTGLHTNGYSLARSVLLERFQLDQYFEELRGILGDSLLTVHRSYYKAVYPLLPKFEIKGMSHITGGGLEGNTMRVIPKGLKLFVDWNAWERPWIFKLIQKTGNVPEEDMRRTFNLGVGLVLIVSRGEVDGIQAALRRKRERSFVVGEIVRV
jgi:phosphoribosylformylglycinamidine cyclo-ligase